MKKINLLAVLSLSTILGLTACSSNSKDMKTADANTNTSTSEQQLNEVQPVNISDEPDLDSSQKSDEKKEIESHISPKPTGNSDIDKINEDLAKDKDMPAEIVDVGGSV